MKTIQASQIVTIPDGSMLIGFLIIFTYSNDIFLFVFYSQSVG